MEEDPYSLEHLLPAGILLLAIDTEVQPGNVSTDVFEEWQSLSHFLDEHSLQLASTSHSVRRDLEFLGVYGFARATWRCAITQVRVRVYLVPFDLQGVRGCLRHRDETKVLVPARKALSSLLSKTDRSEAAWICNGADSSLTEPFICPSPDARSLSEIFGELPSPEIDASKFLSGASPETRAVYVDALQWDAPPGMRPLYPYQRRTVIRMLQQELDPGMAVDPLYIPITGVGDTRTFYLQPSTMELLQEPPMRAQPRGGILCEEMGTGKTCMVLALVMATKHQLPAAEDPPWDAPERPVLTPLAFRHFPFPPFQQARAAARLKNQPGAPVPTLVELLTHFICTSPERLGPPEIHSHIEQQPHLWGPIMHNLPFYHVFEHLPETTSPRRRIKERGPRQIFLSSATLVVVPRAIMTQWNAEINKHCEGGSLRVLELDNREKSPEIPPVQELASKFDIILITHERFAAEKVRCDPSELYTWKHCECEEPQGIRIPYCTCIASPSVSPLVQIRWKRLIVDEGHVSAAPTNLAVLAQELSVERKWIVSGTPTRNLMGLSLGQSQHLNDTDIDAEERISYDDNSQAGESGHSDDGPALDDGPEESALVGTRIDVDDPPSRSRQWTSMDRDDLNRLRVMIAKFIGVPQFANGKDTWRKQVAEPLLNLGGPKFGAIQVVTQVMTQVMFRHQIRIVEQELPESLPILREKTVSLRFQPLAAKTYNVLQSIIAINAVDSERKDLDYLFHTRNRGRLREALENLTQTMFWRTDRQLLDIDEAIKRSESALKVALERGMPDDDIELVKESIRVQTDAASDLLWRDVMLHEDNPFVLRGLSPRLQDAWLKLTASPLDGCVSLLDSDRLARLRDILVKSPLISEQRLIEHGLAVAAEEEENAIKHEEYMRSRKRKRKYDEDGPTNSKLKKENSKAGSKEKLQEINYELSTAIDRKAQGMATDDGFPQSYPPSNGILASSSSYASLKIGNTLSSKVDYILRKVLKHSPKEKFLIFSALPLSLAYLAEALQVVQVPYLQYTSGVKARVRQQTAVTFETSDKYRVLLMELKLGARGLNLVTASRIIFCEPVWQGDIESQAIKRAHRIGQKSDQIKVSTLVMRGTSEEAMVTRRHALKRKSEKLPAVEEDIGMRKFMQNPTFIRRENIEPHAFEVRGLDIPLMSGPGGHAGRVSDEIFFGRAGDKNNMHFEEEPWKPRDKLEFYLLPGPNGGGEPAAKKTKTVRFQS